LCEPWRVRTWTDEAVTKNNKKSNTQIYMKMKIKIQINKIKM
jgi:hypothetical protein